MYKGNGNEASFGSRTRKSVSRLDVEIQNFRKYANFEVGIKLVKFKRVSSKGFVSRF